MKSGGPLGSGKRSLSRRVRKREGKKKERLRWARARTMLADSADHDLVYHAAFDHESTVERYPDGWIGGAARRHLGACASSI